MNESNIIQTKEDIYKLVKEKEPRQKANLLTLIYISKKLNLNHLDCPDLMTVIKPKNDVLKYIIQLAKDESIWPFFTRELMRNILEELHSFEETILLYQFISKVLPFPEVSKKSQKRAHSILDKHIYPVAIDSEKLKLLNSSLVAVKFMLDMSIDNYVYWSVFETLSKYSKTDFLEYILLKNQGGYPDIKEIKYITARLVLAKGGNNLPLQKEAANILRSQKTFTKDREEESNLILLEKFEKGKKINTNYNFDQYVIIG